MIVMPVLEFGNLIRIWSIVMIMPRISHVSAVKGCECFIGTDDVKYLNAIIFTSIEENHDDDIKCDLYSQKDPLVAQINSSQSRACRKNNSILKVKSSVINLLLGRWKGLDTSSRLLLPSLLMTLWFNPIGWSFVPLVSTTILTNVIQVDVLWTYGFDSGYWNTLVLHFSLDLTLKLQLMIIEESEIGSEINIT